MAALTKKLRTPARRRNTTNYARTRSRRKTASTRRRRKTAGASVEDVFRDILGNLGKGR